MSEISKLRNLYNHVSRLRKTASVDDDFPEKLKNVDLALLDVSTVINTSFCLVDHLYEQKEWSIKTFGAAERRRGIINHLQKELLEIESNIDDAEEWVDVVLLALDGLWRSGLTPELIVQEIKSKQAKNKNRDWPDWKGSSPDKAIEHIRDEES